MSSTRNKNRSSGDQSYLSGAGQSQSSQMNQSGGGQFHHTPVDLPVYQSTLDAELAKEVGIRKTLEETVAQLHIRIQALESLQAEVASHKQTLETLKTVKNDLATEIKRRTDWEKEAALQSDLQKEVNSHGQTLETLNKEIKSRTEKENKVALQSQKLQEGITAHEGTTQRIVGYLRRQRDSLIPSGAEVDFYFSGCDPGFWNRMAPLISEEDRELLKNVFSIRSLQVREGKPKESTATAAFIFHMDAGRWLGDITEEVYNKIRGNYAKVTVIVLKSVKEEMLRDAGDKAGADGLLQMTVTKSGGALNPDHNQNNLKRASDILGMLDTFHGGIIVGTKAKPKGDSDEFLDA